MRFELRKISLLGHNCSILFCCHFILPNWMVPYKKDVHYYSRRPNIYRLGIRVLAQDFRSHEEHGSALNDGRFGIMKIQFSTQSEIGDFNIVQALAIGQKDVIFVS